MKTFLAVGLFSEVLQFHDAFTRYMPFWPLLSRRHAAIATPIRETFTTGLQQDCYRQDRSFAIRDTRRLLERTGREPRATPPRPELIDLANRRQQDHILTIFMIIRPLSCTSSPRTQNENDSIDCHAPSAPSWRPSTRAGRPGACVRRQERQRQAAHRLIDHLDVAVTSDSICEPRSSSIAPPNGWLVLGSPKPEPSRHSTDIGRSPCTCLVPSIRHRHGE